MHQQCFLPHPKWIWRGDSREGFFWRSTLPFELRPVPVRVFSVHVFCPRHSQAHKVREHGGRTSHIAPTEHVHDMVDLHIPLSPQRYM